jgi:hypothetical protein
MNLPDLVQWGAPLVTSSGTSFDTTIWNLARCKINGHYCDKTVSTHINTVDKQGFQTAEGSDFALLHAISQQCVEDSFGSRVNGSCSEKS